ncbi:VWA domain-containing protein [Nocardioides islandensis]|uniref:VWA domain-containing protein n=1 Tax=Nocardioides islandensis TaxID=433663 RepID=A0A930VG69_9ACTN|nr:vWA domain-containing protein [Nocardioides islandensis]MBF4765001.1 VWA domain-containing protein [Nocardioides islandensis]
MLVLSCAVTAIAGPASADGTRGFSEIAGCLSRGDHLLVSVVVDESASLQQTDPQAQRVQGIQAAVDSLQQLAQLSPRLDVELALSTFARGYELVVPWQQLSTTTADNLREAAAAQLPQRNSGDATDYRQALLGARAQLDARAESLGDAKACKAILLFTDGALDVDSATSVAQTQLCQPGGILDSIRQDNISLIALALFTPGGGVTPAQRDLLQAMAEGRGSTTTTCGTVPIAATDSQGVYLPASDPAALQFLFARSGAQVAGGSPAPEVTCPGPQCPGGRYALRVDPGVIGARVIVRTSGSLQVSSPAGRAVPLTQDPRPVDGARVSALTRGALTTINLTYDATTTQADTWTITTHGRSIVQTYWFWGASLRQVSRSVAAGQNNEVQLQLVDGQGHALSPEQYDSVTPVIVIGGNPVPASMNDEGAITARYPLGVDHLAPSFLLSATLTARTSPTHHNLGPIHLTGNIAVTLPPAFPTVVPAQLDFGHLTGAGSKSAQVTITGSELGATKVCLKSSEISLPGQTKGVDAVASEHDCVQVPRAAKRTLDLTMTPKVSADGIARGNVVLELQSSDGQTLLSSLPASMEMSRPVDQGKRWEIVVGLLLVALLFPLLLLIGSNYFILGRYSMASGTRTARRPVIVGPDGLRAEDGDRVALEASELHNVAISGIERGVRIRVPGTPITLVARRVLSLRAPRGIAVNNAHTRLFSGTEPHTVASPRYEAPVTLGRVDAVFVSLGSAGANDEPRRGELFVVVPPGVDLADAQERIDSLSRRVDWSALVEELPEAPALTDPSGRMDRDDIDAHASPTREAASTPSWLEDGEPATPATGVRRDPRGRRGTSSGTATPTPAVPTSPPPEPPDDRPRLPDFLRDED